MTDFRAAQSWIVDNRTVRHLLQDLINDLKHGNVQRDEARARLLATTSVAREIIEGGQERW